jgi:4'-phosphopantetheinyl transferase EntD
MPARRVIMQPRPTRTPAIAPQQIRRHAAFIEKHVGAHVMQRLGGAPAPALSGDVGTPLFVGVYRFF